jgi:hypothetical protein
MRSERISEQFPEFANSGVAENRFVHCPESSGVSDRLQLGEEFFTCFAIITFQNKFQPRKQTRTLTFLIALFAALLKSLLH